jgi:hypothetical protein
MVKSMRKSISVLIYGLMDMIMTAMEKQMMDAKCLQIVPEQILILNGGIICSGTICKHFASIICFSIAVIIISISPYINTDIDFLIDLTIFIIPDTIIIPIYKWFSLSILSIFIAICIWFMIIDSISCKIIFINKSISIIIVSIEPVFTC